MKLLLFALLTFQQVAPRPDSVVVEPGEVAIAVDATQRFTAKAYADGRVVEGAAARWFSPDEEVLVIDNDGMATAVWPGQVRLAATVAGVPGYATVTVEPRSINLLAKGVSMVKAITFFFLTSGTTLRATVLVKVLFFLAVVAMHILQIVTGTMGKVGPTIIPTQMR